MQLSLLSKTRRRRRIRTKLEDISRAVSLPSGGSGVGILGTNVIRDGIEAERVSDINISLRTECALLTEIGELVVSKTGSSRPFDTVTPRIRTIRTAARNLTAALVGAGASTPTSVHLCAKTRMVHAYLIGPHTLVALTEVTGEKMHSVDDVINQVDRRVSVASIGVGLEKEGGKGKHGDAQSGMSHLEELRTMLAASREYGNGNRGQGSTTPRKHGKG